MGWGIGGGGGGVGFQDFSDPKIENVDEMKIQYVSVRSFPDAFVCSRDPE